MAEDRICPKECAALPAALTVTAADPAGNLTLLVESPVPRGSYERAASALLVSASGVSACAGVSLCETVCVSAGCACRVPK